MPQIWPKSSMPPPYHRPDQRAGGTGERADIIDLGSCVERNSPSAGAIVTLKEGLPRARFLPEEKSYGRQGRCCTILSLNSSNLHLAAPAAGHPRLRPGLDSLSKMPPLPRRRASIIWTPYWILLGFTASSTTFLLPAGIRMGLLWASAM